MRDTSLEPNAFYWAKSETHFDGKITVVQVSTAFGSDPEYWTLALLGTDQHAMPDEFDIIQQVEAADKQIRLAAE